LELIKVAGDKQMKACVGLFGTCGGSMWREIYKKALSERGIECYDPQVMPETHGREWQPSDMELEREHLQNDIVLMFKVTGETTSSTSLLEIITMVHEPKQFIVILIENLLADAKDFANDEKLQQFAQSIEQILRKKGFKFGNPIDDATRSRGWIRKMIRQHHSPLIHLVSSDEEAIQRIESCWIFGTEEVGLTNSVDMVSSNT
jgi:hypothetical protein